MLGNYDYIKSSRETLLGANQRLHRTKCETQERWYAVAMEYKRRCETAERECAQIRFQIRRNIAGNSYKFECQKCHDEVWEPEPPKLRWLPDGSPAQVCMTCGVGLPEYVEGSTCRRPLRGEVA